MEPLKCRAERPRSIEKKGFEISVFSICFLFSPLLIVSDIIHKRQVISRCCASWVYIYYALCKELKWPVYISSHHLTVWCSVQLKLSNVSWCEISAWLWWSTGTITCFSFVKLLLKQCVRPSCLSLWTSCRFLGIESSSGFITCLTFMA